MCWECACASTARVGSRAPCPALRQTYTTPSAGVTAGAGTGPSPSQRPVGRSLKAPRQLQEPATGSLQGTMVQLGWGWQLGHRPKGQRHLAQPGASLAQNASSTYLCFPVAARRAGGRLALRSGSLRAFSTLPNTTPLA